MPAPLLTFLDFNLPNATTWFFFSFLLAMALFFKYSRLLSVRNVDVVIVNMAWPSPQVLGRYSLEHKEPLAPGDLPSHCQLVGGEFWTGEIARHDRLRLAYAVWSVLSERLLAEQ